MTMLDGITKSLLLALLAAPAGYAQQSTATQVGIEKRIVRADPSKYNHLTAVHDGAGTMDFRVMLGTDAVEPNLDLFPSWSYQPQERHWTAFSQSVRRDVHHPGRQG